MAGFWQKLTNIDNDEGQYEAEKFAILCHELQRGRCTEEVIVAEFAMSAAEVLEWEPLRDRLLALVGRLDVDEFREIIVGAQSAITLFDTIHKVKTRLGVVE